MDLEIKRGKKGLVRLDSFQKFLDLRMKFRLGLSVEKQFKTQLPILLFFSLVMERGLGMTLAEGKTERGVHRDLGLCLSPVFDQGDIARTLPGKTPLFFCNGFKLSGFEIGVVHGQYCF